MKEMEKDMMCVLLQQLLDKKLITPKIHDNARQQILSVCDNRGFFWNAQDDGKEESHGYTQNPC